MSAPRQPTAMDLRRMQRALALVTAYDIGVRDQDFSTFQDLSREEVPEELVQSLAQLSWLLIISFEEHGIPREKVLDWYGTRFALSAEKLEE